jgi:hypothetical protein
MPTSPAVARSAPADDAGRASPAAVDERAVAEVEDRVAALAHAERWDEAFAAIDPATSDVRLLALRAELLRDVGRRHEALALWRRIVAQVGSERIDAATLAAVAGLERLEGEREAAQRTVAAIRARGPADAWVAANEAELRVLQSELAAGLPIRTISARDLLGNLRGAPVPEERSRALAAVLRADAGDAASTASLHARAVLIAVGDVDPGVRAEAVAAWRHDQEVAEDFCRQALADGSPQVRLAAVAHVIRLAPAPAAELLLVRLADESDATVFTALQRALREVTGAEDLAAPLLGADAGDRAAIVARWRERVAALPTEAGK